MTFCSNCGSKLSDDNKFCQNCGNPVSPLGLVTQQKQQSITEQFPHQASFQVPKVLGIFKELEPTEKIIYQGVTQTEVIFVKEAEIRKIIGTRERKEVPISISESIVYLTNQRLIFLKLFEISATEIGTTNNLLAGVAGTFYEMPISAVTSVNIRPVKLNKNDEERFLSFFGVENELKLRKPALEIIYDERAATGRAKDYIESMLRRGFLSKLWGRVEMTYDKIFVLGEQCIALQPTLSEQVKKKMRYL